MGYQRHGLIVRGVLENVGMPKRMFTTKKNTIISLERWPYNNTKPMKDIDKKTKRSLNVPIRVKGHLKVKKIEGDELQ